MKTKEKTNNWIEQNSPKWKEKGFEIINFGWTGDKGKKELELEIHKEDSFALATVSEKGAFEYRYINESEKQENNKYYKSISLKSEKQLKWELNNIFMHFNKIENIPLYSLN